MNYCKPFANYTLNFIIFFFLYQLPANAQLTVTGRVLSAADKKPVSNASVFLSNATFGSKTNDTGKFRLTDIKPGQYELVVSIVGFETYREQISINSSQNLADIEVTPKTITLKGVVITSGVEHHRTRNFDWFKEAFL